MSEAPIAIFDLDGTLTVRDTFVQYLLSFGRRRRKVGAMSLFPFRVAGYLFKLTRDFELKQTLLRSFFAGVTQQEIVEHTDRFCREWLPQNLHPVGMQRLREHLDRQHRVILLSASPNLYVPHVAEALGIAEAVCTQVEFTDNVCTGTLLGENCKGAGKVTAIQKYLNRERPGVESYAYGDSKHDLPVLRWVDSGFLISPRDATRVTGETEGKSAVVPIVLGGQAKGNA
jgi:phosphatidylglycerophosphatase C